MNILTIQNTKHEKDTEETGDSMRSKEKNKQQKQNKKRENKNSNKKIKRTQNKYPEICLCLGVFHVTSTGWVWLRNTNSFFLLFIF